MHVLCGLLIKKKTNWVIFVDSLFYNQRCRLKTFKPGKSDIVFFFF